MLIPAPVVFAGAMRSTTTPELSVFAGLLTRSAGPFVTIYHPFDPARRDLERVGLKTAVRSAHGLLVASGLSDSEAAAIVRPVVALPNEGVERCRSVVWFCAPGHSAVLQLPTPQGPSVKVGAVPDTLGVAPLVAADGHWFVLALSQNHVRLFRADRHSIEQVDVEGMPVRLDEALWYVRREPTIERHGSGALHVSDSGRQLHKDDIRRFLQMVDDAIAPTLAGTNLPLVVMGVEFDAATFVNGTHYHDVVPAPVIGNPDLLDPATIRERSEPRGDLYELRREELLARARELAGTGLVLSEPAAIADASDRGVVRDLLLAHEATVVTRGDGLLDPDRTSLAHAFTKVAVTGADCVVVNRRDLPMDADAVAVLRY